MTEVATWDVSIRVGRLELRRTSTIGHPPERYLEIVCWSNDGSTHCWTIATWLSNSNDGPYLHFVGDRPFHDDIDPALFMRMARIGQAMLEAVAKTADGP